MIAQLKHWLDSIVSYFVGLLGMLLAHMHLQHLQMADVARDISLYGGALIVLIRLTYDVIQLVDKLKNKQKDKQ